MRLASEGRAGNRPGPGELGGGGPLTRRPARAPGRARLPPTPHAPPRVAQAQRVTRGERGGDGGGALKREGGSEPSHGDFLALCVRRRAAAAGPARSSGPLVRLGVSSGMNESLWHDVEPDESSAAAMRKRGRSG